MIVFNATEMTKYRFSSGHWVHLQAQESMNDMKHPLGHRKMGRISTTKSIEGLLLDLHGFTYMELHGFTRCVWSIQIPVSPGSPPPMGLPRPDRKQRPGQGHEGSRAWSATQCDQRKRLPCTGNHLLCGALRQFKMTPSQFWENVL